MSATDSGSIGLPLRFERIEALVYRAPCAVPVQTSFGIMRDRPALLLRLTDADGVQGWGEIWCNFPSVGAEHRARLMLESVAPLLLGRDWADPPSLFTQLERQLRVLAIQSGEPGPLAQIVAGIDIAAWDIFARRKGLPLWRLLGGQSPEIKLYASGLNPDRPVELALRRLRDGHRAFKLKIGFGAERDLENLRALRRELGEQAPLMVDANQAWTLQQAQDMAPRLAQWQPLWLEEPIAADSAIEDWQALATCSPVALGAGENLRGDLDFKRHIDARALRVLQPDLAKWGGFSRCAPLIRSAVQSGMQVCPHWLGAGIGLNASVQLAAGSDTGSYVEVDSNDNPLRDLLAQPALAIVEGKTVLSDRPGLGVEPDLKEAQRYLVHSGQASA